MKDYENAMQHRKKLLGLYIGEVVNTTDPKNRNRVQVHINGITDEVDDNDNYMWAEQAGPIAKGSPDTVGISSSPTKGEMVYIMFLNGSPSHPIYFAIVRGGSDASSEYDDNYVIHTPDGQKIIIGTGSLKLVSGSSIIEISDAGVAITSGTLTHNGVNIGATHVHGGVSTGQSNTDVPN